MNATSPPSGGSDDIDRQLATFFRGEVPHPWPALAAPANSTMPFQRAAAASHGRMALAASIAVLLAGGWFLSGRLPTPVPTSGSLENGAATVPSELRGHGAPPVHRPR
jgi:hypothetical protein